MSKFWESGQLILSLKVSKNYFSQFYGPKPGQKVICVATAAHPCSKEVTQGGVPKDPRGLCLLTGVEATPGVQNKGPVRSSNLINVFALGGRTWLKFLRGQ